MNFYNMTYKMLKFILVGLLIGLTACNGTKNASASEGDDKAKNDSQAPVSIVGQWEIENIVENDSSYIRPSEVEEGHTVRIDFRDGHTFGVMTNCNHIGGEYLQKKDSLVLKEISSTEMACDNMEIEEMLKKILPIVNSIDCLNDSITRLNSDKSDSYIVLKKKSLDYKTPSLK